MTNSDVKVLLTERQTTHGDFTVNAEISQELKLLFSKRGHRPSNPVHREALDQIALKISRILSGHADFADHWDDIAGYAKLASEACSPSPIAGYAKLASEACSPSPAVGFTPPRDGPDWIMLCDN